MKASRLGASRDRTVEFRQLAETSGHQQPETSPLAAHGAAGPPASASQGQGQDGRASEFSRRASQIGKSIHSTAKKVSRLASLAKRTGMFDDPAEEINELTAVVKDDIQKLHTALDELQSMKATGTNKQAESHSTTVVEALKTRLMGTTQEFKEVLTQRQQSIREHWRRRQLFSSPGGSKDAPPEQGSGGEQTPLQLQEQEQMQVQARGQDMYLQSRQEALQNVERTITELQGIFQQLAGMVAEQGEMAVRIDENVDEARAHVEGAQAQLLKYMEALSSNRWLIFKVFLVLIAFSVFFFAFAA